MSPGEGVSLKWASKIFSVMVLPITNISLIKTTAGFSDPPAVESADQKSRAFLITPSYLFFFIAMEIFLQGLI